MPIHSIPGCALISILSLVIASCAEGDTLGTVTLYPSAEPSSARAGASNRVQLGRCSRNTSPPDAVSSLNRSGHYVHLYSTSDCSGPPVTTLRPYGQAFDRLPAHGPVNSLRAVDSGSVG